MPMRPLADPYRPSGGQGQQREQALDALGLGEMSVLEAEPSGFERREQGFDTPALGELRDRPVGGIGAGDQQPLLVIEPFGGQVGSADDT